MLLSIVFFENSLNVAVCFFLFYCGAFVMKLFAFAKSNLNFDKGVFEIYFERDEGVAFLFDFSTQFVDFALVKKKFSRAF